MSSCSPWECGLQNNESCVKFPKKWLYKAKGRRYDGGQAIHNTLVAALSGNMHGSILTYNGVAIPVRVQYWAYRM